MINISPIAKVFSSLPCQPIIDRLHALRASKSPEEKKPSMMMQWAFFKSRVIQKNGKKFLKKP